MKLPDTTLAALILKAAFLGQIVSTPAAAAQLSEQVMQEDVDARFAHLIKRAEAEDEPFIAIVVDADSGEILAEGINRSREDVTQHSEIAALRALEDALPRELWPRATMYTTAEPCPMCAGALVYANMGEVYYGIDRENLYQRGWRQFRMRAQDVFDDAQRADGLAPALQPYTGAHLRACEELFKPRKE